MGMDIFGKNATTETGHYFRNNIWWWRPLADFVTTAYPEITEGCVYWHSNDGDGLGDAGAKALAAALDRDLASGKIAEYAAQREVYLGALPTEECWLCKGTGIRTDEVGQQYGYDVPRDPATGRGGCNGCSGTGRTEPAERSYPFDVENVREFAAFLHDCGGFEIW